MYACIAMNLPLSTAFTVSHTGWVVVLSFFLFVYKKDLHDLDNHDGVITHLEPDILECEVKWALESITTNKAMEVMEFQ